MKKMGMIGLAVLVIFSGSGTAMSAEVNFPTKPIEFIVGMAPGGGSDVEARMLAQISKPILGQEIIVVNKPGALYMVAYSMVKNAKPDGYTLAVGSDVPITLALHMQKMPWAGPEDFTFIAQAGTLTNGLVVLPDSPLKTAKDMIEFARANPGKLSVAVVGKGGGGDSDHARACQERKPQNQYRSFSRVGSLHNGPVGRARDDGDCGILRI